MDENNPEWIVDSMKNKSTKKQQEIEQLYTKGYDKEHVIVNNSVQCFSQYHTILEVQLLLYNSIAH